MEAMIFVKAAAENGGKVDMLTVDYSTEYGYGEGEMFFEHFLPQFGKTDDFGINKAHGTKLPACLRGIDWEK